MIQITDKDVFTTITCKSINSSQLWNYNESFQWDGLQVLYGKIKMCNSWKHALYYKSKSEGFTLELRSQSFTYSTKSQQNTVTLKFINNFEGEVRNPKMRAQNIIQSTCDPVYCITKFWTVTQIRSLAKTTNATEFGISFLAVRLST